MIIEFLLRKDYCKFERQKVKKSNDIYDPDDCFLGFVVDITFRA